MAVRTTPGKQQTNTRNSYRIPGADDYRDKAYLRGNTKKNNTKAYKSNKNKSSHHGGGTGHKTGGSEILGALLGILCGSGAVAFMLLLVWAVQAVGNNRTTSIPGIGENNNHNAFLEDTREHYVTIDVQPFCAFIGQKFALSVSVYPAELADSLIWNSNNEEVVIVDSHGNIEIVGEGVAAITVTSGEYSDAVALEAVADAYSEGSLGLPFYSRIDVVNGEEPTPVSPSNNGNNVGHTGNSADEGVEHPSDNEQSGEIQQPSEGGQNEASQQPSDGDRETEPQQPSDNSQSEGKGQSSDNWQNQDNQHETDSQEETTQQYTEPVTETVPSIDTEEMFAVLTASGFSQYLSNACLYKVEDDYQGEVIVDSESVHIYIKKRSAAFDQAIKNALAYLIPDTAEAVWNSYVAASTDRTITSGGRKVRFVMPAASAHAQIIVYNP